MKEEYWIQIYEWMRILEPVSGLIVVILGGLMVLILWYRLKPWLELQDRKTDEKKNRIKKLKQVLKSDVSDETRNKASTEYRKLVAVDVIQNLVIVFVFVLIVFLLFEAYKYLENDSWEASRKLRIEMVETIDESKLDLYRRTIREPIDPVCVSEKKLSIDESDKCIQYLEREIEIVDRQELCRLKALLVSFKDTAIDLNKIHITILTYQICMLEEGWSTEPCSKEEKDCVKLSYLESTCTSLTRDWIKDGGDDKAIEMCEKELMRSYAQK